MLGSCAVKILLERGEARRVDLINTALSYSPKQFAVHIPEQESKQVSQLCSTASQTAQRHGYYLSFKEPTTLGGGPKKK